MKEALIILFLHWVFDFVFQTDKMALNKSKDNFWLSVHVAAYSVGVLWMGFLIGLTNWHLLIFWLLNAGLHWITDYGTSRLNSYLWKKDMRHWFFVSIGFDQLLHYTALFTTLEYLKP